VSLGQYEKAVALIRDAVASPESEHPEYKDQIEAAIRQIQEN